MKWNLNRQIKIELTKKGFEILNKNFPDILALVNSDNTLEIQGWKLISIFGNYLFLGCDEPFSMNVEIIE